MASPPPPPLSAHLGCNGKCPKLWRLYLGHYYAQFSAHNGKPISGACRDAPLFNLQTSAIFYNSYLTMVTNKSYAQISQLHPWITSPTSFRKWSLWPFKLNSHPPSLHWIWCRVQLWFIFWHYRLFSQLRPSSFLFTLCVRASVRSDTESQGERFKL